MAVIVHFGDAALTRGAVYSITSDEVRPGRITVVDNGPGVLADNAIERVATVLRPGSNLGFAKAVNRALRESGAPAPKYVWLLNNDAVARRGAFAALLLAMNQAGDDALVSSRVLDLDTGGIWFERARFYPWRLESRHEARRIAASGDIVVHGISSPKSVAYLPGCSLLVPGSLFSAVGGLDESFFLYGEDVDLSIRAMRLGYRLVVAMSSVVDHRASSGTSAPMRERMQAEAMLRLTARYFPWLVPSAVLGGTAYGLKRAWIHRERWRVMQRWSGYWDVVVGWLRARPKSPVSVPN